MMTIALAVLAVHAAATPCALDAKWSFGDNGGMTPVRESFELEAPATYSYSMSVYAGEGPLIACSAVIPDCGAKAGVTMSDLVAATTDSDVVAAFKEPSPVLFGVDHRPSDASVFEITRAGKSILIGDPCPKDSMHCRVVPPGVSRLKELLQRLAAQEAEAPSCKSAINAHKDLKR